ncbi:hypothetical protein R2R35_12640 [Anaerocolumna sp. AGMB13020]|uniref:tetratricopeptide repeat protein n=1 Tax=Anaerocolumna sp. AGMB13020 TaxID=3081750 RepID=UPI0029549737|nr:hypothetical protein [Anaerocolumna sp. AGMB13020]WOO34647.1 hypothetical protein R2R35_12640 [Anaerocolumna sp. AGMB13020]
MERYENIVKIEEIRKLTDGGQYQKAVKILDTMEIHKIKSLTDLSVLADVLTENGRLDEAMGLLERIYEKSKTRRILYQMVELAIKKGDAKLADVYLVKYMQAAPNDSYRFIFRYYIDKLKGEPLEVLMDSLEQLKEYEYIEVWAYELAKLYHKAGLKDKCVRECSDIILWFGDGIYVDKAKLLKAYYVGELDPLHMLKAKDKNEARQRLGLDKTKDYSSIREQINQYLDREDKAKTQSSAAYETYKLHQVTGGYESNKVAEEAVSGYTSKEINEYENNEAALEFETQETTEAETKEAIVGKSQVTNSDEAEVTEGYERKEITETDAETAATLYEGQAKPANISLEDASYKRQAASENNGLETANNEGQAAESRSQETADYIEEAVPESRNLDIANYERQAAPESINLETANYEGQATESRSLETADYEEQAVSYKEKLALVDDPQEASEYRGKAATKEESQDQTYAVTAEKSIMISEEVCEDSVFSLFDKMKFDYRKEFSGFLQIDTVKEDLRHCLENILSDSSKNLFMMVTGEKESGKSTLAFKICKALYSVDWIKTDKIAKITGENLNRVNILTQKDKLYGASLIIENPTVINSESAERLYRFIKEMGNNTFIVLEGTKEEVCCFLETYPEYMNYFLHEISLNNTYTLKQLMGFVNQYMENKEYKMKEDALEEFIKSVEKILSSEEKGTYAKVMQLASKVRKAADTRYKNLLGDIISSGNITQEDLLYIIKEDITMEVM